MAKLLTLYDAFELCYDWIASIASRILPNTGAFDSGARNSSPGDEPVLVHLGASVHPRVRYFHVSDSILTNAQAIPKSEKRPVEEFNIFFNYSVLPSRTRQTARSDSDSHTRGIRERPIDIPSIWHED
jgi:hypothetical protein